MSDILTAAPDFGIAARQPTLRVVTYNIHGCLGLDRRYSPSRIAAVLHEVGADIICLQEVGTRGDRHPQLDQAAYLAEATGSTVILGAAASSRARFANAILTRFPVLTTRAIDLEIPGRRPRAALDVDLMVGGRRLRVIATHFGLHAGERRLQANRVLAALDNPVTDGARAQAVLLVGDLNEWRGRAGGVRALDRCLGPSATPRTFPSWMPVLPLDRIYALGRLALCELNVHRSPLARVASDHLPLIGTLLWDASQLQPAPSDWPADGMRGAVTGAAPAAAAVSQASGLG